MSHRLAQASAEAADAIASRIRALPAERVERLMRSPARRIVLDGIFWQMPKRLDRKSSSGLSTAVRWRLTGHPDREPEIYDVVFDNDRCQVIRGGGGTEPRVTITVDGAEFVRIATGSSDPTRAYFEGRLQLAGDIMFAAKLASLFRIPRATR